MTAAPQFPKLPVVEALIDHFRATSPHPLRGVRIVCVQHLLETTGTLLESFVRLGCDPRDIHVLGKFYSTNTDVERKLKAGSFDVLDWDGSDVRPGHYSVAIRKNIVRLWSRAESRARRDDRALIVLDDGGRCRQFFPSALKSHRPVAVEQTTSGLKWRSGGNWIPTVEVAGSAAKKTLEPPAVTASILRYVLPQLHHPTQGATIGVVGHGTVGQDLADRLACRGLAVNVYDKNSALRHQNGAFRWRESLRELFETSTFILGCTGEDILAHADWLTAIEGDRVLASCSSEDIEFRSVLRRFSDSATGTNPLHVRKVVLPEGSLRILRGGFPANFTGTRNSGPPALIQVTRALLLAGVVQAATVQWSSGVLPRRIMLDPALQALVASSFLTPKHKAALRLERPDHVLDEERLAANSTGTRLAAKKESSRTGSRPKGKAR